MINEDIILLARKLQENARKTNNRFFMFEFLDVFIEDYKEWQEEVENYELWYILEYILKSGFNIDGFEICEIPMPYIYTFCNADETKMFDIVAEEHCTKDDFSVRVYPAYTKKKDWYLEQLEAETIEEAIQKYENF